MFDGAPGSGCSPTDAADVLREHAIAGLLPHRGDGLRRRRARPDRRLHQGAHPVRPLARGVPGASRCRSPTSTSPRGRSTSPPTNVAWRLDQGLDASRRPRGRGVLGLRPRRRRRCAPATTCTAAWASTRPTRCTATSPGSRTSPGCSAARGRARRRCRVEDPTAKNLELTAEQRAFKDEVRDYFTGLVDARRAPRDDARPARRGLPAHHPADGRRRLDGRRLAEGVRRPRARRDRADDLRQRGASTPTCTCPR